MRLLIIIALLLFSLTAVAKQCSPMEISELIRYQQRGLTDMEKGVTRAIGLSKDDTGLKILMGKYFDELDQLPISLKKKHLEKLKSTLTRLKKNYSPEEVKAAMKVKLSFCYKKIKTM